MTDTFSVLALEITHDNIRTAAALIGYTVYDLEAETHYLLNNNKGAFATFEIVDGIPICTGVVSRSLFESRFGIKRKSSINVFPVTEI